MKFELKRKELAPMFKDLLIGEVFQTFDCENEVFIKIADENTNLITHSSCRINAFNLTSNCTTTIKDTIYVRTIRGKFVEEGVNND